MMKKLLCTVFAVFTVMTAAGAVGNIFPASRTDIDGVTRTAGSVDIGCQEFVDSDSDGIPDNIETAAGLNPNDASDAS